MTIANRDTWQELNRAGIEPEDAMRKSERERLRKEKTIAEIKQLSRKIEGFSPLAEILPDCIELEKELELIREYLFEFRNERTAENFHAYCYGRNLSK